MSTYSWSAFICGLCAWFSCLCACACFSCLCAYFSCLCACFSCLNVVQNRRESAGHLWQCRLAVASADHTLHQRASPPYVYLEKLHGKLTLAYLTMFLAECVVSIGTLMTSGAPRTNFQFHFLERIIRILGSFAKNIRNFHLKVGWTPPLKFEELHFTMFLAASVVSIGSLMTFRVNSEKSTYVRITYAKLNY